MDIIASKFNLVVTTFILSSLVFLLLDKKACCTLSLEKSKSPMNLSSMSISSDPDYSSKVKLDSSLTSRLLKLKRPESS